MMSYTVTKAASFPLVWYLRHSPVQRGKTWLLRVASSFLCVRIRRSLWLRVSGVSGVEFECLKRTCKEGATVALIESRLRSGMVVFDVGANVGYVTLVAARCVGPAGRVVAFEPTPAVRGRLLENISLNGLRNVSVESVALSDRNGEATFYINNAPEESEGNSLMVGALSDNPKTVIVVTRTLDQQVASMDLRHVDLLKLDVEGSELRVLRGGAQILSRDDAPDLVLEVNPLTLRAASTSPEEVYALLVDLGYTWDIIEEMPWRGVVACNIHAHKGKR
jgi:FkbM family methyltransferase